MRLPILLLSLSAPAWALEYDEAFMGDITGTEVAPTPLGLLDLGQNTLRASMDRANDAVSFRLPFGTEVSDAIIAISNYQSAGPVGIVRFFRISPFQPLGGATVNGNFTAPLPITGMTPRLPFGFSATGGQNGVVYDYTLTLEVASTCSGGDILWDEATAGDLAGDEASPVNLGALTAGTWVICGGVDGDIDAIDLQVAPHTRVRTVDVHVADITAPGAEGYARLFDPATLAVHDEERFRVDGAWPLDPTAISARLGFSTGSLPSGAAPGATFGWQTVIVVEDTRPTISVRIPPVAGARTTFTLEHLTPGQPFYFAASLSRGATPIPTCPGLVSDLVRPQVIASGNATAQGTFSTTIQVPSTLAGRTVYMQLFDPSACALSELAVFVM